MSASAELYSRNWFSPQRHLILDLLFHFGFASISGIRKRKVHHSRPSPVLTCLQISLRWSLRPPLLVLVPIIMVWSLNCKKVLKVADDRLPMTADMTAC